MSTPQDPRLNTQPNAQQPTSSEAGRPAEAAARRPWTPPTITSSGIFHGVVLASFNPAICGASS